eukprot:UN10423
MKHVLTIESFIMDGEFTLPTPAQLPNLKHLFVELGVFDDGYDFRNINDFANLDND